MSKKKKKRRKMAVKATPRRPWWLWAVGAVAFVLVAGGAIALLISNSGQSEQGTPKLMVDQTIIDEGYQKLDSTVRTSFTLRNEGDATLRILGEPQVELVEGC